MNSKQVIWITTLVGSTIGSCIPLLWGAGFLSLSSVLLTGIGGFVGIYIGYKMVV